MFIQFNEAPAHWASAHQLAMELTNMCVTELTVMEEVMCVTFASLRTHEANVVLQRKINNKKYNK
jgi:hypothetical protein